MKSIHKVETKKPLDSISIRMFRKAKFIWSYACCGKFYPLEKIQYHKMFECPYRSMLYLAQACQFINNVKTANIRSIICPFHLLHCAIFTSLYNVSVFTDDCNVIKSQRTILSVFKNYHNILRPNHSHKQVFLRKNSYI